MGSTLVHSAFLVAQWRDINHKPFRLLVHMAITALDTESRGMRPRLYWKGRQSQAFALGYTPLNCDTAGARSNVSKAVTELVQRGLIQKLDGGFNGRSATYELLLHGDTPSADLLAATVSDASREARLEVAAGASARGG